MNGKQIRVGDTVQLKSGKLASVYNVRHYDAPDPADDRCLVFIEYVNGNVGMIAPRIISRVVLR